PLAADLDEPEGRVGPVCMLRVAGLAPVDLDMLDTAVRVELGGREHLVLGPCHAQALQRMERGVRGVDVEDEPLKLDEITVGVAELGEGRVQNSVQERQVKIANLAIELAEPLARRRDVRLLGHVLPEVDYLDLVRGRQRDWRRGFDHHDAVHLHELAEKDVSRRHMHGSGLLNHASLLAGQDIARAETSPRLDVQDLVEAEWRGEAAFEVAREHGLYAAAAPLQESSGGTFVVQ